MYRILITDALSPAGLEMLRGVPEIEPVVLTDLSTEQLRTELRQADGIVVRSGTKLTAEVLDGCASSCGPVWGSTTSISPPPRGKASW